MNLRELERRSIRDFVQSAADDGYLSGRVLDYGCGKQPYRDIVEAAGGEYVPYDNPIHPANVSGEKVGPDFPWLFLRHWGSVLMTQVIQYVGDASQENHRMTNGVADLLGQLQVSIAQGGHLVMTYPTNWPEIELEDLHRFTKAGMERLLIEARFEIIRHERREIAAVTLDGENLYAGYGVVARA